MAFIHGRGTAVLHGVYDLSAFLNSANLQVQIGTAETTNFGSTGDAKTFITGLKEGSISASGMFDGAANSVDVILATTIGSDTNGPVTIAPEGFTIGNRTKVLLAKTTSYQVQSPVNDVVAVSYEAVADGGIDHALSLSDFTAVSATTNHTSVDNTASSANGGIGQLHVTANSRSTTSVIKVQHSTDNVTFVDLVTFTTVGISSTTSERIAVTGTVNRYLRAQSTLTAGTGSITYQVSFARR